MSHTIADLDTLIIDTVGSIVIVTDHEGRVIRFNAAGTRILGYSADEVLGRFLWDVLPIPENREMARERFARMMLGERVEAQTIWQTRDGQRKHLSFLCKGAPGPSGKIEYTIGTGMDITDRVEAEQALRDSEERFRTTFADAAIGIALVDQSGRYLRVNRAFCELTGYTEDDLLKLDLLSITHPDDRGRNVQFIHRTFSGEIAAYVFEKRYIRKQGQTIWVQVSASLAGNMPGKPPMLIGFFQDISERKRTAEDLRQTHGELVTLNETLEQRVADRTALLQARTDELAQSENTLRRQTQVLQSVLDSMADTVVVVDETGKFLLVNPAGERIAGPRDPANVTLEQISQEHRFFHLDGVTPYEVQELPMSRALRGENIVDEEMIIHRRMVGGSLCFSMTTCPLRDESGTIHGAVLVGRDVTERKKHEKAIHDANVSLEEANASLRKSEGHFKELADTNLRLAREVEHRVRNNLAGLLALIGVMRDRAPDVRSFADAMEARLTAMLHVHQLLSQARWTSIGLGALIEGALATLQHLAPYTAATHVGGPGLRVNPTQILPLTLVLVEWFTNSCKYGAHSVAGGDLDIRWELTIDKGTQFVHLTWRERGGPTVRTPITPSLGTDLIQGFVRRQLAGVCELRYPPEGADHSIDFPIRAETTEKTL